MLAQRAKGGVINPAWHVCKLGPSVVPTHVTCLLARLPFTRSRDMRIMISSQPHPHQNHSTTPSFCHNLILIPNQLAKLYKMLLSSSFFMPPQQQYYSPYTPPRSSPLSERSVNVAPRLFDFNMSSPPDMKKSPTPQRAYKPNPLVQTRDAATKRRRDMFFKRVQNGREDKKWEARGEQVCDTRNNQFNNRTHFK